MHLHLSAGGDAGPVKQQLRDQVNAQIGTAPDAQEAKVAQAVLGYVDAIVGETTGLVSVSVSLSIHVAMSEPEIVPAGGIAVSDGEL